MDSMLLCVCLGKDHRRCHNVVRTSVTNLAILPCVPLSLLLPHFVAMCDLLLNRRTATWNIFVKCNEHVDYSQKNYCEPNLTVAFFAQSKSSSIELKIPKILYRDRTLVIASRGDY